MEPGRNTSVSANNETLAVISTLIVPRRSEENTHVCIY